MVAESQGSPQFYSISDSIITAGSGANVNESADQLVDKLLFLGATCDALQVALAAAPETLGYVSPDYKKVTAKEMKEHGSNPDATLNKVAAKAGAVAVDKWVNASSWSKSVYAAGIKQAQKLYPAAQAEAMDWYCASVNDGAAAKNTTFPW